MRHDVRLGIIIGVLLATFSVMAALYGDAGPSSPEPAATREDEASAARELAPGVDLVPGRFGPRRTVPRSRSGRGSIG